MLRSQFRVPRRVPGSYSPCDLRYVSQKHRSPTAPKQQPDLKDIRANVELYKQNTLVRNYAKQRNSPQRIAELTQQATTIQSNSVESRKRLKNLQKQIGPLKTQNKEDEVSAILEQIAPLQKEVDEAEAEATSQLNKAKQLALALPNLTSPNTPTNGQPKVLSYLNYDEKNPIQFSEWIDHSTIGQELGILNFASASTASGWGFYYLLNEAALLEQALVQYALSVALEHGWKLVTPPSLVYSYMADSCGFQPRDAHDEQQIWQIAQPSPDNNPNKPTRSLAATAEIPLAALYSSSTIPQSSLPLKVIGPSRCYRAEAGARGVDTRGLYRVHEFTKVEMFAWTDSSTTHSTTIFNEMLAIQTQILTSLHLPCRILEMPTSDLGASAYRKIDIEALFPSRRARDNGWGELSSVSICTDYQTRRLDTHIKEASGATARFPHTVNGTAVAVPRVLAAILEHGWDEERRVVRVPEVLWPFMLGGIREIGPR